METRNEQDHPTTLIELLAELPTVSATSEPSMSPTNLPDGQTNKDD